MSDWGCKTTDLDGARAAAKTFANPGEFPGLDTLGRVIDHKWQVESFFGRTTATVTVAT